LAEGGEAVAAEIGFNQCDSFSFVQKKWERFLRNTSMTTSGISTQACRTLASSRFLCL